MAAGDGPRRLRAARWGAPGDRGGGPTARGPLARRAPRPAAFTTAGDGPRRRAAGWRRLLVRPLPGDARVDARRALAGGADRPRTPGPARGLGHPRRDHRRPTVRRRRRDVGRAVRTG